MTKDVEWVPVPTDDHELFNAGLLEALLSPAMLFLAVGVLALLLAWQMLRSRVHAKRLMSRVEREVIGHLEAAVPWCPVHAQVCLGALLEPSRWLPRGTRTRLRCAPSPAFSPC